MNSFTVFLSHAADRKKNGADITVHDAAMFTGKTQTQNSSFSVTVLHTRSTLHTVKCMNCLYMFTSNLKSVL